MSTSTAPTATSASPATRAVEPEGKLVEAGGLTIHYHEFGDGPPVIGLHGGGPGATGWSNFRLNIPAFSAGHRFMPVDMPQFGRSSRVPLNGPRLTRTAAVLDAFMDAIGLEVADFVGNSMGGQAAMRLAIDAPKRVRRLVLIGSTPVPYSAMQPQPLEGIKLLRTYYSGEGPSVDKMRRIMQALVSDQSLVTDDAVRERYEASTEPELLAMHKAGNLFEQENLLAELDRIGCPTLLV